MVAYLVSLAAATGLHVEAKLSSRSVQITANLTEVFACLPTVRFHGGKGNQFLDAMFEARDMRLIQIFGDDDWIGAYECRARSSAKAVLFDGPGKDPFLVFEGSDLVAAVRGAVNSGLFAGGAACMSAERFYVQRGIYERFLLGLVQELGEILPLPPDNPKSRVGFIYSAKVATRLRSMLAEAEARGAVFMLPGEVSEVRFRGIRFYACPPLVVTEVPQDVRLMREETFGPVFPVIPFSRSDEATRLASNSEFGLTATVFAPKELAHRTACTL
jgi:succinate-semialdehyde dehydrogenase/glutarate-semialdehyde dehydrogenase